MKPQETIRTCKHHGDTRYILEGRGYYRCAKCRSQGVANRRRKVKRRLVAYKGGRCESCGYSKCIEALTLHHVDKLTKSFDSSGGQTRSLERAKREADKCELLCLNCHAEVHSKTMTDPSLGCQD